ncbi:MAG: flagellar motor protein MotB [Elusimicrobia bacterium]|nr:flagellar motor protein MotB [Elusimicrobiota bacterium]
MTVYSDMMTNLMLFFLMMFAFNLAGEVVTKRASEAFQKVIQGQEDSAPSTDGDAPPQNLDDFFRELGEKEKDLQVIRQGEGMRLRLPEPVLFDLGKADLKPEAMGILHEIALGLSHFPNTIVVEGHTDDIPIRRGSYQSNWELSEARAESVMNHLVHGEGIHPDRMAVAGYGEYWPFAPNDSDINRALNRRIELLVILDDKKSI